MKETTRDFLAVELLILLFILLSSIVLVALLSELGLALSAFPVGGLLYLCRWVWWAMQHCEAQPQLHRVAHKLVGWSGAMLCCIGAVVTVMGWRRFSPAVGLLGLGVVIGGGALIAWRSKAFKTKIDPKSGEPPSSLAQPQDV
jgi:hypothetical protein